VNIACHVKQSSKTTSFGGMLSWRWRGGMSSVRVVQTATTRILRHRFPGACETVGQVFKFVWRLHWKINAVCMSLSTFVSFQLRFVTYLLTFPRNWDSFLPYRNPHSTYLLAILSISLSFSTLLTASAMHWCSWRRDLVGRGTYIASFTNLRRLKFKL